MQLMKKKQIQLVNKLTNQAKALANKERKEAAKSSKNIRSRI